MYEYINVQMSLVWFKNNERYDFQRKYFAENYNDTKTIKNYNDLKTIKR